MGKGTNSFDYRTFASYLLPKDILKFFEVTDIEEEHTGQLDQTGTEIVILRISLDELDNREQLGLDLRPNGFTEGCDVTDFPIRDHKVVLRIRRRRWLDADGHNAVFNNYELTAAGTSYSKEFADVLKKIYGHLQAGQGCTHSAAKFADVLKKIYGHLPYNSVFLSKVL